MKYTEELNAIKDKTNLATSLNPYLVQSKRLVYIKLFGLYVDLR